jgi:hypothetical protein
MSAYTDVGRSDDDEGRLLAALARKSQPIAILRIIPAGLERAIFSAPNGFL